MALSPFIQNAVDRNFIEAEIVKRLFNVLAKADNPVTSVWDGEEETEVSTLEEVYEVVFNLDQSHLYTKSGSWIFLVSGNDWDMISDYGVSLEEAIKPVNDWAMANS